ncbi:hypothetical protein NOJ05_06985 [Neorhizobium galegae]|uniref:hypothetical protein n=1 Tax=Neorhizobium galegae TaxID=399 RepID=UPI002104C8B8|nr:hypothetical protein [Neorhizobium galegae]MCQ1776940.1 hypothetical protein [Neorhizobium galegae]MCQ1795870.1 hypothetical protein [Neorhizobium galegae]
MYNASEPWKLNPGDKLERKALHEEFGGRTQGGIGPSKSSPNVFVFTDAVAGAKHGYIDGWGVDGCFHYTGEGQYGDQVMKSGNASILRHKKEGRALRLFDGARGTIAYMGEFETDDRRPYYLVDAPETGGGPVRQVIVFRLRPTNAPVGVATVGDVLPNHAVFEDVPLEAYFTERMVVEPSREVYEAERREAELVRQFADYVKTMGHQIVRRRILPKNEGKPIFTDIFLPGKNLLVEAKGSAQRGSIRMAIGQLADYRRFFDNPSCAVLLPGEPREDLLDLCASQSISVFWPIDKGFDCRGKQLTAD